MSKLRLEVNREGKIKLAITLSLLLFSFIVAIISKNGTIALAMCGATLGDIFLMAKRGCLTGKREETFIWGIISFAGSHLFYLTAMQDTKVGFALIWPMLVLFIIMMIMEGVQIKATIPICIPYGIMLIINLINSIYFNKVAVIGMILFVISDGSIAIFDIKKINRKNIRDIIVWGTYIPAQICLISSFLL